MSEFIIIFGGMLLAGLIGIKTGWDLRSIKCEEDNEDEPR
jgi:hypothetical protein